MNMKEDIKVGFVYGTVTLLVFALLLLTWRWQPWNIEQRIDRLEERVEQLEGKD